MLSFLSGSIRCWMPVCLSLSVFSTQAQHASPAAQQLSAAGLVPAEGLKVELFASDPLLFNPVAFSIDEQGRFFIAETHRYKEAVFDLWTKDDRWKLADFSAQTVEDRARFLANEFATNLALLTRDSEIIRLVEDKDGDGMADASAVFADGFNKSVSGPAAGVLASNGELWFTCVPDLWRFTYDTTGRSTSRENLHTGYGVRISVSGHDLHGLVKGPDGRIYFSVGDRGANVTSKEGKQLKSVNTGAVFRCEPDGSHLEIFATGLRNPQELAFDEFGNLWAHDNDTSGEDPPRVMEIVEGGDYGWRQAYQFMPEFGPWVLERLWEGTLDDVLPPAGFGAQGPSGLAAYPGVGLPEKYRGCLLASDFPQGVWAYFFTPKGASYSLRKEHFLWNIGTTDVAFGPDGHTYVLDWGKSYAMPDAGRIVRVFDPGQTNNPLLAEVKELLGAGMSRHDVQKLASLLAHQDMRVRSAAQFELERRIAADAGSKAVSTLVKTAESASNRFARIHALWALGNTTRRQQTTSTETFLTLARDGDPEIRVQAVRQLRLIPRPSDAATSALVALLKDSSPRVRMVAAIALANTPSSRSDVSRALLDLAAREAGQDAYIRHGVVWALTQIKDLESIRAAGRSDNPHIRRAAVLCWRRFQSAELAAFLNDPDAAVRRDAARAINDVPVPAAFGALAECLDRADLLSAEPGDRQILLRAINAAFRLGTEAEWNRVLAFASNPHAPDDLRADAFAALGDWPKPSPLDRVVGIWRPLPEARSMPSPDSLIQETERVLGTDSTNLVLSIIQSVEKLRLKGAARGLAALVRDASKPAPIRIASLQTLGRLKVGSLGDAVQSALADADQTMRATAVSWLPEISPGQAMTLLEKIVSFESSLRIQQSAIAAAARLPDATADRFLAAQLDQLMAGELKPELQLDVLEAAATRPSPAIAAKLAVYRTRLENGDPQATFRPSLHGGDAARGRKLFYENDAIGCIRCHSLNGKGGTVGPELGGIASRAGRELLLESIVSPNARIAPGFDNVGIKMKDGTIHSGIVTNETTEEVVLNSPEDGVLTLKKAEIAERSRNQSAMPEGLATLMSPSELRDLIEFLASLK